MIRRYNLLLLSVLLSCMMFAQDNTANKPILGYYHLGMTYDEHYAQGCKLEKASQTDTVNVSSDHLIAINGISFNAECTFTPNNIDIDELAYKTYIKDITSLYFTGHNYYLDGKLVSMTICTPPHEFEDAALCYMQIQPNLYKTLKLPENKIFFSIGNIDLHNQLVKLVDDLTLYLSKKYGIPAKEYSIKKQSPLQKEEYSRVLPNQWFDTNHDGCVLPRAEWQSGNMKIVMGITNTATIFISFFDDTQLSHQNLDRLFKPAEQVKPAAEW